MPIVRTRDVNRALVALDQFYKELRAAAWGDEPSPNEAHQYRCDPETFVTEHRDIDPGRLKEAMGHLKVCTDGLNNLLKLKVQRSPRE